MKEEKWIAPEIEEYFVYTPKPAYPTNNLTVVQEHRREPKFQRMQSHIALPVL